MALGINILRFLRQVQLFGELALPFGCISSGVDKMSSDIEKRQIVVTMFESDFERSIGRKPKDQTEFDKWVKKANIALFNGCLNWDRFYECAAFGFLCNKNKGVKK